MNGKIFDRPVLVKNGQHIIEEIESLADAFQFLEKWPESRRGPIYQTAIRACQRAYDGYVPLSVARDAFAGFARSVKILEDVSTVLPWTERTNSGRGGVPI
ncbi:hypothetical protein GCM10007881_09030 [Mesorhizobium huakuii]|uniref:DUF982 domain-containing protein n=1 Tax=Mesorhizobium huakuii TaxID=28104 RepID=UPI00235C21AF|nr:DUF982 domain-containing protein [Mesorhizobium huakuii]GLQ77387.1 hypothetical protein GCM10007881_09030 [Mesorhizobium huakuii]